MFAHLDRLLKLTEKQQTNELIYWDGSGLVMAYKRLEDHSFTWPAIKNGVMRLEPAQFEALFAGLDWRRVRPLEVAAPSAAE